MQLQVPTIVLYILHTLQDAGFEAYIVGGAVRDLVLHSLEKESQSATDFDFTTNATPEQILALFPQSYYENTFGTVSITAEHIAENLNLPLTSLVEGTENQTAGASKLITSTSITKIHQSLELPHHLLEHTTHPALSPFEITTFRKEAEYTDFRRPSELSWGQSLIEDLQRRDFTVNAMAVQVAEDFLIELFINQQLYSQTQNQPHYTVTLNPDQYTIIDPFTGRADLEKKIIRTVGNATERLTEDALRMLRAIRFSVQLNMKIEEDTYQSITTLSDRIQYISAERTGSELMKMLKSDYPREAIEILDDTGLLHYIMPELQAGKNVQQGGHHTTDVWTHNLDALAHCPSADPVVRLATLLHDVAKPHTLKIIDNQPTFYNHEIIGSRIAKDIAYRLRLSKKDCERIFTLVRYHMFYYQPENTDASIRRFMRKVGLENINDILDLREADRLGSGARKTSWRLEEMKQRMIEQLNQPFSVTDLAIDGTVLMNKLELKPGKIIGEILAYLFERVLEEPEINTQETLLEIAKKYLSEKSSKI